MFPEDRLLQVLEASKPKPLTLYEVMAATNLCGWDAGQLLKALCKDGKVRRLTIGPSSYVIA